MFRNEMLSILGRCRRDDSYGENQSDTKHFSDFFCFQFRPKCRRVRNSRRKVSQCHLCCHFDSQMCAWGTSPWMARCDDDSNKILFKILGGRRFWTLGFTVQPPFLCIPGRLLHHLLTPAQSTTRYRGWLRRFWHFHQNHMVNTRRTKPAIAHPEDREISLKLRCTAT